MLYLIEILHQTTTLSVLRCFVSALYLIEILHQTTTILQPLSLSGRCILSKFYIKPQLFTKCCCIFEVVSYRNSTSNHNLSIKQKTTGMVVSYRNSTSNHNYPYRAFSVVTLYLIEILHQTTTLRPFLLPVTGCILSKFYIKPQLSMFPAPRMLVVSYRNSTSNHNIFEHALKSAYVVSYRNSTSNHNK